MSKPRVRIPTVALSVSAPADEVAADALHRQVTRWSSPMPLVVTYHTSSGKVLTRHAPGTKPSEEKG